MIEDNVDIDVLIVGLGPVGAVAANLAGKAGLRTVVLEQGTEPYRKPRAIVFDAEIMRIFASIDLATEIAAITRPLGGSVYLGADLQPIRTYRAPEPAHGLAWHASNLFYQPELEGVLRKGLDRFPNVTVLSGHEVIDIEQAEQRVSVRARSISGKTKALEAHFLLACDGASSTVRKRLGIGLDDIGFEERWLVVDTFINGPMRWPEDHVIPPEVRDDLYSLMVCDPTRPCTLIPGSGRHRRWEYMLMDGERDDEVVTHAWLQEHLARWTDPDDVEIVRAAVYRFRALVAERWRTGRILLLGDAAHQTPPFFGQGMCHGIRDAAQLTWRLELLLRGVAGEGLLESYQAEREPHVREIISASVAAGAAVCKLDPDEARARDIAFRAAEQARAGDVAMSDVVPPMRAGLVDVATGGMRQPEFVVTDQDAVRHVDSLLAGRFTLLCTAPFEIDLPGEWAAVNGQVVGVAESPRGDDDPADADGRLSAWFEDRAASWALVRPDRYVFATGKDQAALNAALPNLFSQLHLVAPDQAARGRTQSMEASLR